jgi:hypothetical protein
MMGAGIFNDLYIGANFFQPRDVIAAWADRHPVVGDAVIKPVCTDNLNAGVAMMKSTQDGA